MYIKLDENMDLIITIDEPIFRCDNLNRKITYLIPTTVGDIDMLTASVFLSYIRADGEPDVVTLERMDEMYKESYFKYQLPVTCSMTKYAGEVCTWIQIYNGAAANPSVSKSGECFIRIRESKNMDDYIGDRVLTAMYQLQSDMKKKADGLMYDSETRMLQLKSEGLPIDEAVVVPPPTYYEEVYEEAAREVEDTWCDMTAPDDGGSDDPWESM